MLLQCISMFDVFFFRNYTNPCQSVKDAQAAEKLYKLLLLEQFELTTELSKDPKNSLLVGRLTLETKTLWKNNISICPIDPPNLSKYFDLIPLLAYYTV